jgi:hypothetical protein
VISTGCLRAWQRSSWKTLAGGVPEDPWPLESEETYEALAGGVRISQVRWFGQECDFYVLVHDLLRPVTRE